MTSIIILVHNAYNYVKNTIETLQMTKNKDYEVIVLDNASEKKVQKLLLKLYQQKKIDKLFSHRKILYLPKEIISHFAFVIQNQIVYCY